MKKIISLQNSEIKLIASLAHAKHRYEHKSFVAEGLRVCSTLLEAHATLKMLYITPPMINEALRICSSEQITEVTEPIMKKISFTSSPSGILGIFEIPSQPRTELSSGIVLLNISDPGNAGTLMRTCAAMGKKTAIFIEGVDPWHPKVVQASAGTIGSLRIFQLNCEQLIASKKNLSLCALVVQNGKKSDEINFSDILFVIGNEAHGIPATILEQCEQKLTLDMPGNVESLNAAIAGSIALYLAWHT